jgi:hypothetical protein
MVGAIFGFATVGFFAFGGSDMGPSVPIISTLSLEGGGGGFRCIPLKVQAIIGHSEEDFDTLVFLPL